VQPVHGNDAPLPLVRPAAGVGKAWPPDRPPRHTRVASRLVEAEPTAVPAKNVALVTVITARAVAVLPGLLPAVSVPLT
jgi:hypothetical protein